jgi:hypothetical protein
MAAFACVFALSAGAANAAGKVTIKYRIFPGGGNLLPSEVVTGSVTDTAKASLPGTKPGVTYQFLFWNVDGDLNTNRKMSYTPPSGQPNFATAWYLKESGGGPACTTCAVGTWAFSLTDDKVMTGVTPIGSVSPSGLWTSPSTSASTMTSSPNVTVTARSSISPPYPAATFQSWLELVNTPISGSSFTVPAKTDAEAIGFYKSPPRPPPKPGPCPKTEPDCHY